MCMPTRPFIIDGSLVVNGDKDTADRVYFLGDRLDDPYKDFPASWPGIFFRGTSKDNVVQLCCYQKCLSRQLRRKIFLQFGNPKITLNETIIDNAYDYGIVAIQFQHQCKKLSDLQLR